MRSLLAPALALLVACGDPAVADGPTDGAVDSGTAGDGAVDTGASADGAPSDSVVDTGPAITFCQQGCTKPADCATTTTPGAYDASHWSCNAGVCRYEGCKTDAECTATFGGTKPYKCHATAGSFPACVAACSKPADCATTSAAYDADNYACNGGACEWKGCNDDAECKSSLAKSNTACRSVSGLRTCVTTCSAPADCTTIAGAFDADNYACEAGVCTYLGCKSDAECTESFKKAGYVCR
ncbi:MAG: hypothetical protein JNL79_27630 [Myxococcales bacterium]|nr:hypothetical protein [Myxococcales bacterium]